MTKVQNGTLPPKYREAGFELFEDDHTLLLKNGTVLVARFSATGANIEEICKECDIWLKTRRQA